MPAAHPEENHHAVPERLPLREEVLWLRCRRALPLWPRLQLCEALRVCERLRLRRGEVSQESGRRGRRTVVPPAPHASCTQPALPGWPHEQSTQPRSAHDPHQRTTRLRRVSRARNSLTAALFGLMPTSEA